MAVGVGFGGCDCEGMLVAGKRKNRSRLLGCEWAKSPKEPLARALAGAGPPSALTEGAPIGSHKAPRWTKVAALCFGLRAAQAWVFCLGQAALSLRGLAAAMVGTLPASLLIQQLVPVCVCVCFGCWRTERAVCGLC